MLRRMVLPHWLVARCALHCHWLLNQTPCLHYKGGVAHQFSLLTLGINPIASSLSLLRCRASSIPNVS